MSEKVKHTFPGCDVTITARHATVTEAIKNYALDKLARVERFADRIIECAVTMDIQKNQHTVTIVFRFNHFKIKVTATTDNMYASIDKAVDRLETQVRKYKEKMQHHQGKHLSEVDMNVNVIRLGTSEDVADEINEAIEEKNNESLVKQYMPHEVVKQETQPLKTLNLEEAILKMELIHTHPFLIFRSEEDKKLKVLYRRDDGNYALVEPE